MVNISWIPTTRSLTIPGGARFCPTSTVVCRVVEFQLQLAKCQLTVLDKPNSVFRKTTYRVVMAAFNRRDPKYLVACDAHAHAQFAILVKFTNSLYIITEPASSVFGIQHPPKCVCLASTASTPIWDSKGQCACCRYRWMNQNPIKIWITCIDLKGIVLFVFTVHSWTFVVAHLPCILQMLGVPSFASPLAINYPASPSYVLHFCAVWCFFWKAGSQSIVKGRFGFPLKFTKRPMVPLTDPRIGTGTIRLLRESRHHWGVDLVIWGVFKMSLICRAKHGLPSNWSHKLQLGMRGRVLNR